MGPQRDAHRDDCLGLLTTRASESTESSHRRRVPAQTARSFLGIIWMTIQSQDVGVVPDAGEGREAAGGQEDSGFGGLSSRAGPEFASARSAS